jgi:plastocyanin
VLARVLLVSLLAVATGFAVLPGASAQTARHHSVRNWHVWVGSESRDMAIQSMRFLPGRITVDAGDSVTWIANSTEIHTVTFLKDDAPLPPNREFNLQTDVIPAGGHVYDGHSYYNSGLMTKMTSNDLLPPGVPLIHKYRLTFPKPGTYTYWCLVHGVMMKGVIHVQRHDARYPHTQRWYDSKARSEAHALVVEGRRLEAKTLKSADRHHVWTGAEDTKVSVMRFLRATVTVHVGESVTFTNPGRVTPHTVTFGKEPPPPEVFTYLPSASYHGGNLNSFIPPGQKFKVTFTKAGTYHYVCALHDMMGMVGKVVVRP